MTHLAALSATARGRTSLASAFSRLAFRGGVGANAWRTIKIALHTRCRLGLSAPCRT